MDTDTISIKRINELEQQITQLLKTMRSAKIQDHEVYSLLQDLEQELGTARRSRYDDNNSEYVGY